MITIDELEIECEDFIYSRFEDYYNIKETHLDFIDANNLEETKKNMLYTYEFLDEIYQQFYSYHIEFPSYTCKKLHFIIKKLFKVLRDFQDKTCNYKKLFEHYTTYNASLLIDLQILIDKQKHHVNHQTIKRYQNYYNQLKLIHQSLFDDIFLQIRQEIQGDLKYILNIYLLYFDSILWQDAVKSEILRRYFQSISLKTFDTPHLLKILLAKTKKVTVRYTHLQKALKAYT